MNPEPSLMDVLDHQPDILADAKIKAVMSDIYDTLVKYVKNNDSTVIADLLTTYGSKKFVEIYISDVYLPATDDIKVMGYTVDNMDEVCEILSQALSNLTPKEALDNMNDEKDIKDDDKSTDAKSELEEELKKGEELEDGKEPLETINATEEPSGATEEVSTHREPNADTAVFDALADNSNKAGREEKEKALSFLKTLLKG